MPIIIDGNNLLHSLPKHKQNRREVRQLTLNLVRHEATQITVIFDGPPPAGSPSKESLGRVSVIYSGAKSADEKILRTIPGGKLAKNWVVVTDDRQLSEAARQKGAQVRSLRMWRNKLSQKKDQKPKDQNLSKAEVSEWEEYFRSGKDEN